MTIDEDSQSEEDVQREAEDGNLFVSRKTSPVIIADDVLQDRCDLVNSATFGHRAAIDKEEDVTEYGCLRAGGPNRYYSVIGRGPPNAEKLELISSYGTPGQMHLNDERRTANEIRLDKQSNKPNVAIQGVAWVIPECHEDPISLMDPRRLEAQVKDEAHSDEDRVGEKKRRAKIFPYTTIKLKWLQGQPENIRVADYSQISFWGEAYGRYPRLYDRGPSGPLKSNSHACCRSGYFRGSYYFVGPL
ncbi:hypothetical protein K456DRAFT_59729 [Colletotrichum gloeosporioides 23]|nr:hypothetical protein K456DRAFT_59729 [Colletotrichum gloeosporioides 23]